MADLSSTAVGGRIVECNDEFFAEALNLINPSPPVWKEDEYTDQGKWMDGWETRRRRSEGHDWCVLRLGVAGQIRTVEVDTAFFTGNYPEQFSLEGCGVGDDSRLDEAYWVDLIPKTDLQGDSKATFDVEEDGRITHIRLNIFPDGGVARLRVDGDPIPSMAEVCPDSGVVNLASLKAGTEAVDASDAHYSPPSNMLRLTDPVGMWDGWETKRRRGAGNDWVSFRLGLPGEVQEVVIDTRHFKGNAPGWVSISLSDDGEKWAEAVHRHEVEADSVNEIVLDKPAAGAWLKVDIHPDGGVARVRALGTPNRSAAMDKRVGYLNSLLGQEATNFFHTACASTRWVAEMLAGRPYETADGVVSSAELAFVEMEEPDWLEAFAGHPRIGERGDDVANREQAGASGADGDTKAALAEVNREYEDKFGFTYIVFASGKSAREMLEIARDRLGNNRNQEVDIGAQQQRLITKARLRRMLCMGPADQ